MLSSEKISAVLSHDLPMIFDNCTKKQDKFFSCFIIRIKGKSFGKLNLALYKNSSGKYYISDGGFIFNHMIKGHHKPKDYLSDINSMLSTNFEANGQFLEYRVHNYSEISRAIAAFFIFIHILIMHVEQKH